MNRLLAAPRPWLEALRERFFGFRDRLVADPGFRQWAARFPLTRPLARRRARQLFDLNAGFVYSQILSAAVRLGVFEALRDGPLTPQQLALRIGLGVDATRLLCDAAVALRLLSHRRDARIGLGELGAALIDNPGVAAMVRHHAMLYADLADPVALLQQGRGGTALARYWAYAGNDAASALQGEDVASYSALMADSQPMVADEVLGAYSFAPHRCLLDVGGGEGAFLAAVGARNPSLRLMLFDLPAVVERASGRLRQAGLLDRTTLHGGSFHDDALPAGADIVSLVRVVHDHDDEAVVRLLRRVHAALPSSGTLLIAEPMSATPGAEPVGDAYFGFYLLAMGRGRPRRASELHEMLRAAGFAQSRSLPTRTPMVASVIVARK
jgi:demethylspheroidene O-methyltransferase